MTHRTYKRVHVIANARHGMHRAFLLGVESYAAEKADIELDFSSSPIDASMWNPHACDGVITALEIPYLPAEYVRRLSRNNIPIVWFTHLQFKNKENANQVFFYRDDLAIGRLAAEHFLERGFREFAYIDLPSSPESKTRGDGFATRLREAKASCTWFAFKPKSNESTAHFNQRITRWLTSLPIPVAILAFNDGLASRVPRFLHHIERTCPGNVALLGVDNDEIVCRLSAPALSSIDANWFGGGFQAAQCLYGMMEGNIPKERHIPIQPKGVVLRASTDFLAIEDDQVLQALCFIREHISTPLKPRDVLARVHVSRPTLDRRFTRCLGHTVFEEIIASQVRLAKTLLAETDLTIETISEQCGLSYPDRLFGRFKSLTGMTPGQYRKKAQTVPPPLA